MSKEIIFVTNPFYGRDRYYPENDAAKKLIQLFRHTGGMRKTLRMSEIETLRELGINIVVKNPVVTYE